jgi:hypothetical protein
MNKTKNIIAITAYNKPELLYLYLEQIYKEPTIKDYGIRVYTEEGFSEEESSVINEYKIKHPDVDLTLVVRPKHPTCPLVGFHNILTSYLLAAEEAKDFVIIGEEDMIPTEDYVRFNKFVYDYFLSKYERIFCAAHKRRQEAELIGDGDILIGDYQCTSPSCVSVDSIEKYMRPYFEAPGYFENPMAFNVLYFSDSRMRPYDHTHHDGAIERIMWKHKLFSLKPDQSRSMHVGLSGIFCKGTPPTGTFQERLSQWRNLIKDGEKLRSLSSLPSDLVVTDPKGPSWNILRLDLHRSLAKASSWWYDTNNEFKTYIYEQLLHRPS